MRDPLDDIARSLGVLDFMDWVEAPTHQDVVNLYQRHDVFLFPSRIVEGMGGVNAEAMACGLPVLGTTKYGTAQIIKHGSNGFSHEPGDHLTLGNQLAKLADNRSLVAEFSARALSTAMLHHPDRVIDAWEQGITQRMS